jgi:N-hydroxyarylamine O-acetyltransferase
MLDHPFSIPVADGDAYLQRIGLGGAASVSADGLESLHRAQAYAIPFENFDVLLGRGIDLDPEAVFDKLVRHRRGGYCFELNGLLLMALRTFGFDARALLARVHLSEPPSGRGHMLLLVTLDGRQWIADVGFGGPGLRAPIPFELGRETEQDGQRFRLVAADPFGTMLQTGRDGQWQNLYSFDLSHVTSADIAYGNHFTSTHPSSFFTYRRVAALPRPTGRVTLYDMRMNTSENGTERSETLSGGSAFLAALEDAFGIVLDADYSALPPLAPA